MKYSTGKWIVIFALLLTSIFTHGQVITGKVLRQGTDSIIAHASVYVGGSTKGTITDNAGMFSIGISQTKVPLIVSCVGYYSAIVDDYVAGKPVIVYLKPKLNVMREVQIGTDGLPREEKMRIFKREFIGTSFYADYCTILNPDDIDLDYDKDSETLTAFCNNPIMVKNKKLGYTISYYLDRFTRTRGNVVFAGNYLFKEDTLLNVKEVKRIKENREDAYTGSRMQFIRLLYRNEVDKAGYELYDRNYKTVVPGSIVFTDQKGDKYLSMSYVIVAYKHNYNHPTIIVKKQSLSFIDKDGYYGAGLLWSGPMGNQRIGDMLPFEYVSPQDRQGN